MTSRVQLALNVTDIDSAVAFYEKLFQTPPAKREPGYANFAIADPPLKLVLFDAPGANEVLNHLGVKVETTDEVEAAQRRLTDSGLDATDASGTCCFALQDKVWIEAPDGVKWEVYTVLADSPTFFAEATDDTEKPTCCS